MNSYWNIYIFYFILQQPLTNRIMCCQMKQSFFFLLQTATSLNARQKAGISLPTRWPGLSIASQSESCNLPWCSMFRLKSSKDSTATGKSLLTGKIIIFCQRLEVVLDGYFTHLPHWILFIIFQPSFFVPHRNVQQTLCCSEHVLKRASPETEAMLYEVIHRVGLSNWVKHSYSKVRTGIVCKNVRHVTDKRKT